MTSAKKTLLIASYLEPEHVARIRAVDERLHVVYEPELLPAPRYAADHTGPPRALTEAQERRWREYLAAAEILFDFDHARRQELPDLAPNVRWIQATSAGIGQFVRRMGYDRRMPHTVFTTASGVHAQPLAEFAFMAILVHYKNLARLQADQQAKRWERYATTDLAGRTLAVVGLGKIGQEIARIARAFGMRTTGTRTRPDAQGVDVYFEPARLRELLAEADVVVLAVPHTDETEGMIGAGELAAMKPGAYLVNVARGAVVDEPALVAALQSGRLAGAALDVFAQEPLPAESPLWEMPNVLVSPHSASTSDRENARITDLFCDNLRRYLDGRPLHNVLDTARLY